MVRVALLVLLLPGLAASAVLGADLRLATFRVDVTPPVGDGPCIGFMPRIDSIEHPLEVRGAVLRSGEQIWVVAAIDSCGLCNGTDELFRGRIAEAAGTTAEQVALQSLHQHTAPALDSDGARLLHVQAPARLQAHEEYVERMSQRTAAAVRESLGHFSPVTRVVTSSNRVERMASNRRVPLADGTLAVRGSATTDPALHVAPEGLIDPWLRSVAFFSGERPLAQWHYYASHPQSFYGDGRVSWDVPGMARDRLEGASGVFQIYFTGCGGNIGFAKYNRGTRADREALVERLYAAMAVNWRTAAAADSLPGREATRLVVDVPALPDKEVEWRTTPLRFRPRFDGEFVTAHALKVIGGDGPFVARLKAAMHLAWNERLRAGQPVTLSRLRIGPLELLHLPGEPFVEFQLAAQRLAPRSFVCVAGYGECGVWYYGPDSIFTDRGGYEQTWSFTAPCEQDVLAALSTLIQRD